MVFPSGKYDNNVAAQVVKVAWTQYAYGSYIDYNVIKCPYSVSSFYMKIFEQREFRVERKNILSS